MFVNFIKRIIKKKPPKWFFKDLELFQDSESKTNNRFYFDSKQIYPITEDKTANTQFDAHYVYHTAWAAKIVYSLKNENHTDISSSLYFNAIISSFKKVEFYDYRPANLKLSNLNAQHADITNLHFPDNSIESLSCMHVVEHIGLGRYGDPINYDADLAAVRELKRVLKIGGNLLFVVPIGKSKIVFNAHRIYSYSQVVEMFTEFTLIEFSLIPDDALETGIIINASQGDADKQNYGCGCFWFCKKK